MEEISSVTTTAAAAAEVTPATAGQRMSDVATMDFATYRESLCAAYAERNAELAERLALTTTPDELVGVLNSDNFVGVGPEHFDKYEEALRKFANEDELEAFRERTLEKYQVTDPESGERVLVDFNNPRHLEQFMENFNVFVKQNRTDGQRKLLAAAAAYQMDVTEKTLRRKNVPRVPDEGADLPTTMDIADDETDDERRARQLALVTKSLDEYNAIVTADAKDAALVHLPVRNLPFKHLAKRQLPLSADTFKEARRVFSTEARNSLCTSCMYPTVLFQSKLQLVLYGQRMPRVEPSFQLHATMHTTFMWLIQTDLRPKHERFLDEEERVCRELQQKVEEARAALATMTNADARASEEAEVKRELEYVAKFARGVALARKAYADEKRIESPYQCFAEWRPLDVPRHSKDEIVAIVEALKEAERVGYNERLAHAEAQFRAGTLDERAFLKEFWILNHVNTVNTIKIFEVGILLMYERVIPAAYRADMSLRVDVVRNVPSLVLPQVVKSLEFDRDLFRKVRDYYTTARDADDAVITYNGVHLDDAKLAPAAESVDPDAAFAPSYAALAHHYRFVTREYSSVENVARAIDSLDLVFNRLYDEHTGNQVDDVDNTVADLELAAAADSTQKKAKRRK